MTPQLKSLAGRMAEEKYDGSVPNRRSLIRAFLAGFEARDGMLNEEYAEMLKALREIVYLCDYAKLDSINELRNAVIGTIEIADALISKIESNV